MKNDVVDFVNARIIISICKYLKFKTNFLDRKPQDNDLFDLS